MTATYLSWQSEQLGIHMKSTSRLEKLQEADRMFWHNLNFFFAE